MADLKAQQTSMKNRFEGPCCHCGKTVLAGKDTFEKHNGKWKPLHLTCRPDFVNARNLSGWKSRAQGTGKAAQRARKQLRGLANG